MRNTLDLSIYINSYTPDGELQNLVNTFNTQGLSGLEMAFSKTKGRGRVSISMSPSLGDFKFIRSATNGNETTIVMATDRILSLQELRDSSALNKYRFSVIEFRIDAQGKGEGTMTYAAKLKFNAQGELEVESYDALPIPLGNVRKQK